MSRTLSPFAGPLCVLATLAAVAPALAGPRLAARMAPEDPRKSIVQANAAARVQPSSDGAVNAMQVYAFEEGALFQVYAAPGQITDIMLQSGEALSGTGPVAAGDTTRWVIGDTVSGAGATARVHILVKPTHSTLQTNLVVNTDRRTYHIELHATPSAYMASVSWRYPQDEMLALKAAEATKARPAPERIAVDLASLNFAYRIDGDRPTWRPLRAFDDGHQVFIDLPPQVAQGEAPPLFVRSADGKTGDLVNYRLQNGRITVDRLFDVAELKLGGVRGRAQRVRITRLAGR